jgi:hypothetical protein
MNGKSQNPAQRKRRQEAILKKKTGEMNRKESGAVQIGYALGGCQMSPEKSEECGCCERKIKGFETIPDFGKVTMA